MCGRRRLLASVAAVLAAAGALSGCVAPDDGPGVAAWQASGQPLRSGEGTDRRVCLLHGAFYVPSLQADRWLAGTAAHCLGQDMEVFVGGAWRPARAVAAVPDADHMLIDVLSIPPPDHACLSSPRSVADAAFEMPEGARVTWQTRLSGQLGPDEAAAWLPGTVEEVAGPGAVHFSSDYPVQGGDSGGGVRGPDGGLAGYVYATQTFALLGPVLEAHRSSHGDVTWMDC